MINKIPIRMVKDCTTHHSIQDREFQYNFSRNISTLQMTELTKTKQSSMFLTIYVESSLPKPLNINYKNLKYGILIKNTVFNY